MKRKPIAGETLYMFSTDYKGPVFVKHVGNRFFFIRKPGSSKVHHFRTDTWRDGSVMLTDDAAVYYAVVESEKRFEIAMKEWHDSMEKQRGPFLQAHKN